MTGSLLGAAAPGFDRLGRAMAARRGVPFVA